MPNLLWDPLERAAAFAQLGKLDLARTALDELLTVQPDFALNPRRYLECFIFQDQLVDAVLEGLNKAGYQEPE